MEEVEPPRGEVEAQFLGTVLLGESIAPFRLLTTALAVIPAEGEAILDPEAAATAGHRHLAVWLRGIDAKWTAHCGKRSDGTPRMTLAQQLDHMRKLSMQLPASGLKVVYTGFGTLLSAVALDDPRLLVEHAAYWSAARTLEEARYLTTAIRARREQKRARSRRARAPEGCIALVWVYPAQTSPSATCHLPQDHPAGHAGAGGTRAE